MTTTPDVLANKLSEDEITFTLMVLSGAVFNTLGELYSSNKVQPLEFLSKQITDYGDNNNVDAEKSLLLTSLTTRLEKAFEAAAKTIYPKKVIMIHAGETVTSNSLARAGASRIDFFMAVVTSVVKKIVSQVDVINNKITSVRLDHINETDFKDRHLVTVEFSYGTKQWVYDVFDSDPNIRPPVKLNGVKTTKLDKTSSLIRSLLNSVALYIAMEKALFIENEVAAKNPVILTKAKMMAEVLGGDFRNYLSAALELHAASRPLDEKDAISDEMLAKIIKDEYRCTSNEADQVVMVFTRRPKYH